MPRHMQARRCIKYFVVKGDHIIHAGIVGVDEGLDKVEALYQAMGYVVEKVGKITTWDAGESWVNNISWTKERGTDA